MRFLSFTVGSLKYKIPVVDYADVGRQENLRNHLN